MWKQGNVSISRLYFVISTLELFLLVQFFQKFCSGKSRRSLSFMNNSYRRGSCKIILVKTPMPQLWRLHLSKKTVKSKQERSRGIPSWQCHVRWLVLFVWPFVFILFALPGKNYHICIFEYLGKAVTFPEIILYRMFMDRCSTFHVKSLHPLKWLPLLLLHLLTCATLSIISTCRPRVVWALSFFCLSQISWANFILAWSHYYHISFLTCLLSPKF